MVDRNGHPLKVGDVVTVQFQVCKVFMSEEKIEARREGQETNERFLLNLDEVEFHHNGSVPFENALTQLDQPVPLELPESPESPPHAQKPFAGIYPGE